MAYGIISDTHYHNWRQFASTNGDLVNSRLQMQLDATRNAAGDMLANGITDLIHAGDCFHVRGSIPPSVLNPVLDTYQDILNMGMNVYMIPGNHDLESNDSHQVTNASSALAGIGVKVITESSMIHVGGRGVLMVPWFHKSSDLLDHLKEIKVDSRDHIDVIIHAPVNGVIMGIPDVGINASELAELGFHRVFAGHYHNFKEMTPLQGRVFSIGALCHQTWSDVGSVAGHLLVDDSTVHHRPTTCPLFVDVDPNWQSEDEARKQINGNYVRVKMEIEDESEVAQMHVLLERMGALDFTVHPIRKPQNAARKVTVDTGVTMMQSITEYVDKQSDYGGDKSRLTALCADIMGEVDGL